MLAAAVAVRVWRNVAGAPRRGRGRVSRAAMGAPAGTLIKVSPAPASLRKTRATGRGVLAVIRAVLAADARWPHLVPAGGALVLVLVPVVVLVRTGRLVLPRPVLVLVLVLVVLAVVRALRRTEVVDPVLAVFRSCLIGPDQGPRTADREDRTKYPLPGAKVWGPVRRYDWGWEVDGEAGGPAPSNDDVRKQVHRIAGAYRQPTDAFTVLDRAGNGGFTARFTDPVWTAVRDAERWSRMNRMYPLGDQAMDQDGAAVVAVQIESGEPGEWEVHCPEVGARHGIVAGDTRSGKSEGLQTLMTVMCRSGLVVPVIIDLAGGVSFGGWEDHAAGYATTVREAEELLDAGHREYEERLRVMRARGWKVWRPSKADPLLAFVIDEGPELKASKRASSRLGQAVRLWAKAGMCVVYAAQSLTIESILGKDAGSVAKTQLMSGNLWIFYANQGLAGLPFDVSDIPPGVPGVSKIFGPRHQTAVLVRGLYDQNQVDDLAIPPFHWHAEPVLHRPDPHRDPVGPPMRVVREKPEAPGDAVARALGVLGGEGASRDVIAASGLPQATAYAAFARLVDDGRAASPRRGVWSLVRGGEGT
jgi:hypothetical protein